MPFKKGQSGNPNGRPPSVKRFADALHLAVSSKAGDAVADYDLEDTTLRGIVQALAVKALNGDVAAIKEVADRLDGKVPQAVVGDSDADPISLVHIIERRIVHANPTDSDSEHI